MRSLRRHREVIVRKPAASMFLPVIAAMSAVLWFAGAPMAHGEERLEDRVSATDMTDAPAIFALATWCKEHRLPTKAQQYYNQTIKVDKDHEGARAALGFVRVGDRWVNKAYAPAGSGKPAAAADAPRRPTTPGPTAAQVQWDLTVPADPAPTNAFITKYIDRLPTVGNDSNEMDVSVATCVDPKNWPSALSRLCATLKKPEFNDLYGAASMVSELARKGRTAEAKPLIGFMVKASERVADPEDLETFCYAIAVFKDRRAVPRLIELMEKGQGSLANAAAAAVAAIAMLPPASMTVDKAHEWWDINCNVSERETSRGQLRSADPAVAVEAAKALYPYRDPEIMPVLIGALKGEDKRAASIAISVIAKVTGNDWSFDANAPIEQRTKIADRLAEWWKQEKDRFIWVEDRSAAPAGSAGISADPCAEWVAQLDSMEGNKGQQAEASLRERGDEALPALIDGLSSTSSIVRRKCNDQLRTLTRQDFSFDPRAADEERAKAIAAWKAWLLQTHPPAKPAVDAPATTKPVDKQSDKPGDKQSVKPNHDVP